MRFSMKAGAARVAITPPVGAPMSGFAGRGSANGIHDELTATALVLCTDSLEDKEANAAGQCIVLICCDLLSLGASQTEKIRLLIASSNGLERNQILIASSHNHYGPVTDDHGDALAAVPGPQVGPYMANLANTLDGVVRMALSSMVECRLYMGDSKVTIGINRRERTPSGIILGQNPEGPVEPRVGVLRVERVDGRPIAAVVNYACHGVSLGPDCTHYSADFPGVARRVVEEETGAICLYMQGAAGDINPLLMGWNWNHLVRLGLPLGAESVRAYWAAEPIELAPSGLSIAWKTLHLPPMLPVSEGSALVEIEALEREANEANLQGNAGDSYWAQARMAGLRRGLAVIQGMSAAQMVPAEITAVAFGSDAGLITAPGEIFTRIGQHIVARSPFRNTLYSGYTNGSINYVPTRDAYADGGYEVTHGCQVAPEAGETLEEESVALLQSVHERTQ